MKCQFPPCDNEASFRLEVDNLEDDRRLVGFDQPQGKIILVYYCTEHFREEVRGWVGMWNRE